MMFEQIESEMLSKGCTIKLEQMLDRINKQSFKIVCSNKALKVLLGLYEGAIKNGEVTTKDSNYQELIQNILNGEF